ncbi:MAG: hypothetical protein HC880_05545 [Bacteroidia bacterium]|nr:hypothetical protein [Bacteroidia bacterium]
MFLKFSKHIILFIGILLVFTQISLAQKKDRRDRQKKESQESQEMGENFDPLEIDEEFLKNDSLPDIELELSEEEITLAQQEENQKKRKNKKKKKKIYFGIKTKGGLARQGNESNTVMEVFRYIEKENVIKDAYQQEIYYYDVKTRRVRSKDYQDFMAMVKKNNPIYLLHGRYEKYRDRNLREEGYFYKGTKHGKWLAYDSKEIVEEKIKYEFGHTRETKIIYYDNAETKIKEIIPMVHGRMQGIYYQFYENGVLAVRGEYQNNRKVNMWREWYETRQRMRDTMYPINWWEEKEPSLLRQWDTKGYMTFDIDRGGKQNR